METKLINIIAIDVNSHDHEQQLIQPNQQLVSAFEALLNHDHDKLKEFAQNYYSTTLELTRQGTFFPDLSSLRDQHHVMRETLQSLEKNCGTRLDCLDTYKKLSAVIFAGAASATAAVAAANSAHAKMATVAAAGAAAAILLLELRKWIHSLLEKREADVKKHKEITGLMIDGVENAINDLKGIIASSCHFSSETKSMPENGGGRKKRAALRKSFQELRNKAADYNENMKSTKHKVNRILHLL
ncbi:hypothetical protein AAHA92_23414 [Salvia divinorum]|uniref:Uncharacterized protein n=1 Tax=Salvia divinorum TaxID=28513 RepID=A0ABD1GUS6_SALDI